MSQGGTQPTTGEYPAQRKAPRAPREEGRPNGSEIKVPGVRVIPGPTADTAKIEWRGQLKIVAQWETDAALEMTRGDSQKALLIYDVILTAFPRYAKAWYNKAYVLHTQIRDYPRALEAYDRARKALPGNLDIIHNMAKLLADMRKHDEALAAYAQVLQQDPNYLKSLEGSGALLINTGRPQDAIPRLERAVEIYKQKAQDPYRAQQLLATAYSNLGREKDALRLLDAAIGRHPEDDSLWEARGIALSNEGRYRDAVMSLTKALRINKRNKFAWDTREQLLDVCKQNKIKFSEGELSLGE